MKIVITIIGRDRVGIVATISTALAEQKVNILDINQNIVNGFFNMVLIGDMAEAQIDLRALQALLVEKGEAIGVEIRAQHEDIFTAMHRI